MLADKDLKRKGRGSHGYRTEANSGLTLTKWYDNKGVHFVSTYNDPTSVEKVKRWDRSNHTFINIDCPTFVKDYNKNYSKIMMSEQ